MERIDMKQRFDELYDRMSRSGRVENMKLFGDVMKDMMDFLMDEFPDDAEKHIKKLEAVEWNNYLTKCEAERIVDEMKPVAPWDYETLERIVKDFGGVTEQKSYFNSYALWVTMSMIYSDSARTIACILGDTLENIPQDKLIKAIYLLAIDKLKDEDGKFSVRNYFGV